jgi:PAT family beta-lactamase induction signal transducer AmpG
MKTEDVNLGTIGLFSLVGLPYTLKFLWAPLTDRYQLTNLGRRRSWMLISQLGLLISTLLLAFSSPKQDLIPVAAFSLLIAFFSATQDIVLDAWRRESLSDTELGFGSSVHVAGYLFAFRMISGAFALILADHFSWSIVYTIMAIVSCVGLLATIMSKEPPFSEAAPKSLKEAVVLPFLDFFKKPGAIWVLVFILLYKLGDNLAVSMTMPLYLDLGYTKTEVGSITKIAGWISLTIGGLIGGALITKLKIIPSLVYFGIFQAISTIGFSILTLAEKNIFKLSAVISIENLAIGMGTSAFVAYMASLTNRKFSATQYALLTSLMAIPSKIISAPSGFLIEKVGYFYFFFICAALAIPGLLLIPIINKDASAEKE